MILALASKARSGFATSWTQAEALYGPMAICFEDDKPMAMEMLDTIDTAAGKGKVGALLLLIFALLVILQTIAALVVSCLVCCNTRR